MTKNTTVFSGVGLAYTTGMKTFLRRLSIWHDLPFKIRVLGMAVAGWVTIMAVSQLFKYEDFPGVIDKLWEAGGSGAAHVLAAVIVVCEVFALPFLLNMKVSPIVRVVSLVCGWFTVGVWLAIALWQVAASSTVINQGYFGATIPIANDWLALVLALLLATGVASMTILMYRNRKTA